jgi:toxin CcdB
MAQLDVFANPIATARRGYPLVAVLQSDLADTGSERLVAPLAVRARMSPTTPRLAPVVAVGGTEYRLLVPRLAMLPVASLRDHRGQLAPYRDAIVAALDLLFLGV